MKNGKQEKIKKCCICGKRFEGFGNNPAPVRETGECCERCNSNVVVPARIMAVLGNKH